MSSWCHCLETNPVSSLSLFRACARQATSEARLVSEENLPRERVGWDSKAQAALFTNENTGLLAEHLSSGLLVGVSP